MRLAIALTHILEAIHTRRILHGDAHPANILYSRTVTSIALAREGLNDSGQIAFTAYFADGGSAVVLATPVPEGSTAWLLAAGLLVMGLRIWKPRGSREPRSHKRAPYLPECVRVAAFAASRCRVFAHPL
ncbi:MAG: PEP-CTERM sorting domain-containing protein [Proteobacteria bacterium]|nr:PEP-CTERM sorting domain-containing protein [Pseudomonadota bacterium]